MTEYSTTDQGPGVAQGVAGAESIDLLIRHLESAKQVFSSPAGTSKQDEELTLPDTVCTLLYAQPGTFCPLLYIHFPAAVE
jgi:hypothetical protein